MVIAANEVLEPKIGERMGSKTDFEAFSLVSQRTSLSAASLLVLRQFLKAQSFLVPAVMVRHLADINSGNYN